MKAGGKLEEEIWNEFSHNKENLRGISQAIINTFPEVPRPTELENDQDEEFVEGRVLTKLHKIRERSPAISKKKKSEILIKTGRLVCEACGFDFYKFYGEIGQGVAECHHTKPISELKQGEKTKLSELSILCANCHRVIHKSKPMFTVAQLKKQILQ